MSRKQVWKVIGLSLLVCGLQLYGTQAATPATFDPSDSQGTYPTAINPSGVIAGFYLDTFYGTNHGFVRSRDGTITPFDPSGYPPGSTNTTVTAITPDGTITGYYLDTNNVYHGFLRAPNGTFKSFDDPNAGSGSNSFEGTFPLGINRPGKSQAITMTLALWITVSCVLPGALSPPSIPLARPPRPSIHREISWVSTSRLIP